MSKTLKVSDEIYQELEGLLQPRETFSQVIERILRTYRTIVGVAEALPGSHYLKSPRPPSETMTHKG
ncbi:MAG: hypothetical protein KKB38_20360 [Gammaproteobacteria bacterium]|nr:hypothetical protein [Gammaproteobacteria bacterium]